MSGEGKEPFRRNTPLEDLVATIVMTTPICAAMIGVLIR